MTTQHQAPEVTSELRECPFPECDGTRAAVRMIGNKDGWQAAVECDCGARGPMTPTYQSDRMDCRDRARQEAVRLWNTRATQPLSLTVDEEMVARLRKRYTAETVPPCPVCGEPLSIQAAGGGSITWGCVKRDDGKSPLDDHYERSRWRQFRTGDSDVIALLDRLQSLSLPVAGEQIAENANCSGDIDRSGLAQEVE